MTDLELIFNMLGEKSTTEITKSRDDQGFEQCLDLVFQSKTIKR